MFDEDIMCIDYCLKHSVSFAGNVRLTIHIRNEIK
jgi:hypothetical protein